MGNIGSHVGPYLGVGTNIKRKRTRSGPTPVHRLCVLLTDSRLLLLGQGLLRRPSLLECRYDCCSASRA
jgi:hypothetical protein